MKTKVEIGGMVLRATLILALVFVLVPQGEEAL